MGWKGESRRHSLSRKGIKTNIDKTKRLSVRNYVARGEDTYKGSIYTILKEKGIPTDHHESDLYVKATPEAIELTKDFESRTFFKSNIDGELWIDLPFRYDPFWIAKEKLASGKEKNPNWYEQAHLEIEKESSIALDVASEMGQNFDNIKHTRRFRERVAEQLKDDSKAEKRFRDLKNAKIYDNGGETADRYTVVVGGSVYGMSDEPFHPQGVNLYSGEQDEFKARRSRWMGDE